MPAKKVAGNRSGKKQPAAIPIAVNDWRTTDQDEILRRGQRARDDKHAISNAHPEHPIFSTFAVNSPSGMTYQVEVRDLNERSFSCTCPDFRTAGLATCKHVEATLIWLKRRHKGEFRLAKNSESPRIDVVPDGDTLRIERTLSILPKALRPRVKRVLKISTNDCGLVAAGHHPRAGQGGGRAVKRTGRRGAINRQSLRAVGEGLRNRQIPQQRVNHPGKRAVLREARACRRPADGDRDRRHTAIVTKSRGDGLEGIPVPADVVFAACPKPRASAAQPWAIANGITTTTLSSGEDTLIETPNFAAKTATIQHKRGGVVVSTKTVTYPG